MGYMQERSVALGILTHSYSKLLVTCGIGSSYDSMGTVFSTKIKDMGFCPQDWRR